jgi:glycosyltransferase involved in cell wall biosynthesis
MVDKVMTLSVIVPAYKQEKTIQKDLVTISKVLEKIRYDYEIIVVVDGNLDHTFENAWKLKQNTSKSLAKRLVVTGYEQNQGKGHAVRYGIGQAKGDYIAFIDAGMDLNPNGLSMILEHLEWYEADIIVGSKRHPASQVHYPPLRRVYSWGYQMLVKILFGLKIKDTQVGMKVYRRDVVKDIMPRLVIKEFAFDIEILAVAHRLGYRRIYEAPIKLSYNFKSSVRTETVFKMLWDTIAVYYRMYILKYYDNKSHKAWKKFQLQQNELLSARWSEI